MKVTARQKEFLKAHARYFDEVVVVGREGLTDAHVRTIRRAIEKDELIKVRLGNVRGPEKKELARQTAARTGAELIAVRGHVIVLFRQKEEGSRFILPTADEDDQMWQR